MKQDLQMQQVKIGQRWDGQVINIGLQVNSQKCKKLSIYNNKLCINFFYLLCHIFHMAMTQLMAFMAIAYSLQDQSSRQVRWIIRKV